MQARILELLKELQREMGIAYVLVSHDLSVVSNFARRVLVLRHGPVIEQGSVEQIFNHAASAYTQELIEAKSGRHEVAMAVAVLVLVLVLVLVVELSIGAKRSQESETKVSQYLVGLMSKTQQRMSSPIALLVEVQCIKQNGK